VRTDHSQGQEMSSCYSINSQVLGGNPGELELECNAMIVLSTAADGILIELGVFSLTTAAHVFFTDCFLLTGDLSTAVVVVVVVVVVDKDVSSRSLCDE
jgi:hypothetical protein